MDYAKVVREYVVSNFLFGDAAALQDDVSLLDRGIIDSTGVLELIMFLEDTYKIKIGPDEMVPGNFDSVNKVVQFLTNKLK